jgi:putative transcriptional regulator
MKEKMMDPGEFAKFIQINLKTYYSWESGFSTPSLKESLRISNILNKNVNDIWYLE